ncbi:Lrp/AsnC family transcriptional regulator [Chloroflexota bacterium]
MDELDQKILSEFEHLGFQKSATLAHLLGLGERTVRRRINNMINDKAIKVIAVPNPVLFGYKAWAKIGIKVAPEYLSRVARVLVEHPSVYFVAYALGRFDIIIAVRLDTLDRLTYFVNSELTRVNGILSTETWMFVSPRKYYHFSWPAPIFQKTKNEWGSYHEATVSHSRYEVDEVDRRIFGILREDGLTRPASLKSRLGIGEGTIRKRMKDMLDNEVYKVEVVPNPEILEYEAWATMGITINHQSAHKLIDSLIKYPAVYLASVSLGRFNVIIAARFQNTNLLNQFVTGDLSSIPGISSVETHLHNKPLKYHNINWPTSIKRP